MSAVRLRDARIGYGDVAVVQGVDLTVRDGEAVAVLGSNGSGKTTLARGLLGLATVLGGEVDIVTKLEASERIVASPTPLLASTSSHGSSASLAR